MVLAYCACHVQTSKLSPCHSRSQRVAPRVLAFAFSRKRQHCEPVTEPRRPPGLAESGKAPTTDGRSRAFHPSINAHCRIGRSPFLARRRAFKPVLLPEAKLPRSCAACSLPYSFRSFCLSLFQIQLQAWTPGRKPHTGSTTLLLFFFCCKALLRVGTAAATDQ
jgi:hypothetical protein